jgi:hypothetical protein
MVGGFESHRLHQSSQCGLRRGICVAVCVITPRRTPACQRVQDLTLCFHADVPVECQHSGRDVPGNLPDDAVVGL